VPSDGSVHDDDPFDLLLIERGGYRAVEDDERAAAKQKSRTTMIVLKNLQIASRTDIGLVRQGNEDNLYVVPTDHAAIEKEGVLVGVADGMGGHNAGEVASQIAVETLATYYDTVAEGVTEEQRLAKTIQKANERILDRSNENLDCQGLGTTLTSLLVKGEQAIIGHVGDCRIYLCRKGRLTQITMDHSLVQEAVREGILTPEQARVHPQRNIITRALGTQEDLEVDTLTLTTRPGDLFFVSSDGLHGLLEDFEMEDLIHQAKGEVDQVTDALVEAALDQGGTDNITIVVVRIPGGDPLDTSTPEGDLPESLLETTLP